VGLPEIGELGEKVGMRVQSVMWHSAVGQHGDSHVDDVIGELAAVQVSFRACVVVGEDVREQIPREGARLDRWDARQ
jgi:hypothetical protein